MPGVLDVVLSLVLTDHLLYPLRHTVELGNTDISAYPASPTLLSHLECFLCCVVEHNPSQVSELLNLFGPVVVLVGVLNDDVLVLLRLVAVREDGGYLSLGILRPVSG